GRLSYRREFSTGRRFTGMRAKVIFEARSFRGNPNVRRMTANTFRVGIHTSIAGGLPKAVESAAAKGCDGFQIFARNPRGWTARGLGREEVCAFREARERAGLWPLAIHSVYLINLASQDPVGLERSRRAFREEIERGLELGAD